MRIPVEIKVCYSTFRNDEGAFIPVCPLRVLIHIPQIPSPLVVNANDK